MARRVWIGLGTLAVVMVAVCTSAGVAFPAVTPPIAAQGTLDVGAPVSAILVDDIGDVVVSVRGGLRGVAVASDGTLRPRWSLPLAPDTQPVALLGWFGNGQHGLLLLDRSTDAVLVMRGDPRRGYQQIGTLPAGDDPTAMTIADVNSDYKQDLAIADAGGSVTVWMGRGDGTWNRPRTFAVGGRPVAIASGSFDARRTPDLAVVDAASDTLTFLYGDGKGRIRERVDRHVGPGAASLAVFAEDYESQSGGLDSEEPSGENPDDVAVVSAGDDAIRIFTGRRDGARLHSITRLPAGSRPVGIRPGSFAEHAASGAVVELAGARALRLLVGDGHGHLRLDRAIALRDVPVAIDDEDVAGDGFDDMVVADAGGRLQDFALGDRLIVPDPSAQQLSADGGSVYWTARRHNQFEAHEWRAGRVATMPIPRSSEPIYLAPEIGPSGHRELGYVRCRRHACEARARDLPRGPDRNLHVRAPPGCQVVQFARWRHLRAYHLASRHRGSCSAAERGLWIDAQGRAPRRVATTGISLAGVRAGAVAWSDVVLRPHMLPTVRMRMATATGRPHTLDVGYSGGDACDEGFTMGGLFDGRYLYWSADCFSSVSGGLIDFKRISPARHTCRAVLPDIVGLLDFDFAVDASHVFYEGERGIFQMRARNLRWPPLRCHVSV